MAAPTRYRRARRVKLVAVQGAALVIAAVFLTVAVAGFTSGLTSGLDRLAWMGRPPDGSPAQMLGVFDTSVTHNLLHLFFGVAGLALARTFRRAKFYLVCGGIIYLGLWLWGTLDAQPRESLPLNGADNWLHLGIGIVMVVLGVTLAGSRVPTGAEGELLIPE